MDTIKYTALIEERGAYPDILIYTFDGPATLTRETRMDLEDMALDQRMEDIFDPEEEDEEEGDRLRNNLRVVLIWKGDFNYMDVVHDDRC